MLRRGCVKCDARRRLHSPKLPGNRGPWGWPAGCSSESLATRGQTVLSDPNGSGCWKRWDGIMKLNGKMMVVVAMVIGSMAATGCSKPSAESAGPVAPWRVAAARTTRPPRASRPASRRTSGASTTTRPAPGAALRGADFERAALGRPATGREIAGEHVGVRRPVGDAARGVRVRRPALAARCRRPLGVPPRLLDARPALAPPPRALIPRPGSSAEGSTMAGEPVRCERCSTRFAKETACPFCQAPLGGGSRLRRGDGALGKPPGGHVARASPRPFPP